MSEQGPVRVAVVNDYAIVVGGVASMLEPYSDQVVVVELDSREPVVSDVDVVLFDTFSQLRPDRVDLGRLTAGAPARVVVYSWAVEPELVRECLRQGAAGYLAKNLDGRQLAEAIVRVHRGERVVPAPVEVEEDAIRGSWPGQEAGLTARESEVLALITQGLSNQEIADRSYLSINSVKTYVRTAYRKLGVSRRSQAVAWCMRHGFQPDRVRYVDGRVAPAVESLRAGTLNDVGRTAGRGPAPR